MAREPRRLNLIDTDKSSAGYRERAIDLVGRRLLITRFAGSQQEKDLSEPVNCAGFGRIRHFRKGTYGPWPMNPLPIDPAARSLGLRTREEIRAQVFQNAVCNWRCWYCFVDFKLLSADTRFSDWLSAEDLIDLYMSEPQRPSVIDLTGGQPDLTPEWLPWTMNAMRERRLDRSVYLWSDDNLSNDYFWRYLTDSDHEMIAGYPMYGRVACFKGFDAPSFSFNTAASPDLFERQFTLFRRLLGLGIDLYAYVTLTCESSENIEDRICWFVDRLQSIHPNLPLRTVPLEIKVFTPVHERMNSTRGAAISNQYVAVRAWMYELERRFSAELRQTSISEIPMRPVP